MAWLLLQHQKIEAEWRVDEQRFPSEDAAWTEGDRWMAEDPVRRRFSLKLERWAPFAGRAVRFVTSSHRLKLVRAENHQRQMYELLGDLRARGDFRSRSKRCQVARDCRR